MMLRRPLMCGAALFVAATAAAQIFDPDDFVDPSQRDHTIFISRLIAGAAVDHADAYRPLDQNVGFVMLANSLYWKSFQFDYKHSEVRGSEESAPERRQRCGCTPPLYFPTPPSRDATPLAPLPGRKEMLQLAWYAVFPGSDSRIPPMRYRLTLANQPVSTIITSPETNRTLERLSGRERSVGLDADTFFHLGRLGLYGSALYTRTKSSGTTNDRTQQTIAYMSRLPTRWVGPVLVRGTVTVGGISGRGATAINLVNPAIEAFYHHQSSKANVHVIWSPQLTRSGAEGWRTNSEIAFVVDRALFVHLFAPK